MNLCAKTLLAAAVLLVASSSIAQEPYHSPDPDLMARLSYDISGVAVGPGKVRHVCLAISRDGDYRIARTLDYGRTQRLHGSMPKEEFRQLNKFLENAEFRNLSGDHVGVVRREAESFAAEIPLGDRWREDGALGNGLNMKLGVCSG
jgi:hypothetical protein